MDTKKLNFPFPTMERAKELLKVAQLVRRFTSGYEIRYASTCTHHWPGITLPLGKSGYWGIYKSALKYLGKNAKDISMIGELSYE